MSIELIHYVEKIYPNRGSVIEKINKRDPLTIINDGANGFRFFDVLRSKSTIEENRTNVSEMYYFGERKLIDDGSDDMILDNSNSIIICDNGSVIEDLGEDDLTIEEYNVSALIEEENGIIVERKSILEGLAKVLKEFENDDFYFKENVDIVEDEHTSENIDAWWIETKRTYSIYLADSELVNHTMISSTNVYYNGTISTMENQDSFACFSEIREALMPIIGNYPYLLWFLDQIKFLVQNTDGKIDEATILDLADEYLDNINASKKYIK